MRRRAALAIGVLLVLASSQPGTRADTAKTGTMSIPVSLADLAAAAGLRGDDPSTLPIDIVRLAYASPDWRSDDWARRRAAIIAALDTAGESGARIPLPLAPRTWRERLLGADVPDARLASKILGQRATALIYHGLLAVDGETLAWIEANPAVLDVFKKHPGATAVYLRSIRVRNGAVVTPGQDAGAVWRDIVGADPANAAAFIPRLLSSRYGAVAAFYDGLAHVDSARQRFVLGAPGDPRRGERTMRVFEAAVRTSSSWRLDDYPFLRPDVDLALALRLMMFDGRGVPVGPTKDVWSRVFGENPAEYSPIDAEWVASNVLKPNVGVARRRLDALLFAQRALEPSVTAPSTVADVLRDFGRYPALMLTLEANGVRGLATYTAAGRAAAALQGDDEATTVFQAALAIVDRARVAGTLRAVDAEALTSSLMHAVEPRTTRASLLTWMYSNLWPALRRASGEAAGKPGGVEALIVGALAGPPPDEPPIVDWEGGRYTVDLVRPERVRLASVRKRQEEPSLDEAFATASARNMTALSHSLTGLVYALALGEQDSPASNSGAVWRRHRLHGNPDVPDSPAAWRVATEVFAADGWHLRGSLLRLDLALAHLALRRIDPTEVPSPFSMSTLDQRSLARAIALMDSRRIADGTRDAVSAAIARGRERVAALAAHADTLDKVAADAALSEWRTEGIRWLLTNDASRIAKAFTTLEMYRLGAGAPVAGWGAAGDAISGCYCLYFPGLTPWEEYTGRASTGQLGAQLVDVMLRTAEALSTRRLPAILIRDVAAFAMQDVIDTARPGFFDDWLPVAFAARDLKEERFDDYVAALTASGPLVPVTR